MKGYLGETKLKSYVGTPYENFSAQDWALHYIDRFGQIDGAHHKLWVLDQVARILLGTPVELSIVRWKNEPHEYNFDTTEPPTQAYLDWVANHPGYNEGIAP